LRVEHGTIYVLDGKEKFGTEFGVSLFCPASRGGCVHHAAKVSTCGKALVRGTRREGSPDAPFFGGIEELELKYFTGKKRQGKKVNLLKE